MYRTQRHSTVNICFVSALNGPTAHQLMHALPAQMLGAWKVVMTSPRRRLTLCMLLQKLLEVGQAPVVLSALQRGAELGLDSTGRTSWLELFKEFGKNGDMSSVIKWVPSFGTVADNPRVLLRVQHVQQVTRGIGLVLPTK